MFTNYEEGRRADLQTNSRGGQIYRLIVGESISAQQEEGKADLHSRRSGCQIYTLGGGEGRSLN